MESIKIYMEQIHNIPQLSEKEEKELFLQYRSKGKKSEEAYLKIIKSNLPLVVSLAKKYYYPGMNVEFLNFIEEGNIGLLKAVEKFDVTKEFKFSTYAAWWIEKYFQSIVIKSCIIQVPEKVQRRIRKIEETTTKLLQQTGQHLDIKEISISIGASFDELYNELQAVLKVKNVVSLDSFLDSDGTRTLGEIVSSEELSDYDKLNEMDERQRLKKLLNNLSSDEKKVLKLRFRLFDDKKYTYKEIGKILDISSIKAKEIQIRAIKKLKKLILE